MKLKYYLRGLGIGILVTAFIFIATPGEKESLSDVEIRERALQLGMVDSSSLTLADMQGVKGEVTEEAEKVPTSAQNPTRENETAQQSTENITQESEAVQPSTETVSQESEAVQPSTEAAMQESQAESPSIEQAPIVVDGIATIVIKKGTHSYAVAKDLKAAGLIEDALSFDNYLCNNGYSRSISVGTHKIPLGTSEEEIAKIITGKR